MLENNEKSDDYPIDYKSLTREQLTKLVVGGASGADSSQNMSDYINSWGSWLGQAPNGKSPIAKAIHCGPRKAFAYRTQHHHSKGPMRMVRWIINQEMDTALDRLAMPQWAVRGSNRSCLG